MWRLSLVVVASLLSDIAYADTIKGIDVSKYQGAINWHKVKESGVKFVYIKATQGHDRIDDRFYDNWHGADKVGIPRGAYHFVNWCDGPSREVANFINTVPNDSKMLPPVLDVETNPNSKTCHRILYPEQIIPEIHEKLQLIEKHYGRKPIIYTGPRFYKAVIANGGFEKYDLWVASYTKHPREHYGNRHWKIWQHSEQGRIKGIKARVDLNRWHGSKKSFREFQLGK